ncbi:MULTISPECIES: hypothetical protein [Clostridium]|uniref:Uncharacterized protein n=1 Tax=Clostridium porci TaxID=2605778 RepID=A0A7X2TEH1_9CLOT|nr:MULTISPECIES: hypothetical protein [Clostridium]MCI6140072.1 hypothetical protein [Clostridium sp.]MDU3395872.1 hypothetical protein [Clostridiales bacterium]MSS37946.1 hypothetical protein [Clostridium porci]
MLMRKEDKCTISVEHFANTKRYLYDDTEIYIDRHATARFWDRNEFSGRLEAHPSASTAMRKGTSILKRSLPHS